MTLSLKHHYENGYSADTEIENAFFYFCFKELGVQYDLAYQHSNLEVDEDFNLKSVPRKSMSELKSEVIVCVKYTFISRFFSSQKWLLSEQLNHKFGSKEIMLKSVITEM